MGEGRRTRRRGCGVRVGVGTKRRENRTERTIESGSTQKSGLIASGCQPGEERERAPACPSVAARAITRVPSASRAGGGGGRKKTFKRDLFTTDLFSFLPFSSLLLD